MILHNDVPQKNGTTFFLVPISHLGKGMNLCCIKSKQKWNPQRVAHMVIRDMIKLKIKLSVIQTLTIVWEVMN
jgi:hypothetical protein